jgi:DNA-binding NtrC family response regulator
MDMNQVTSLIKALTDIVIENGLNGKEVVQELKKQIIYKALKLDDNNKTHAARRIGYSRKGIYLYAEQYPTHKNKEKAKRQREIQQTYEDRATHEG